MSWVDGVIQGFDLETTGVDTQHDRPVSFSIPAYEAKVYTPALRHGFVYALCNPHMPIPAEASAIHGIYDADFGEDRARTMHYREAIAFIGGLIEHCTAHENPICGMNVKFDLSIVNAQWDMMTDDPLWGDKPLYVLDILVLDRHYDKYRKGSRKLVNLCQEYGVVLMDAHNALADARASVEILYRMVERYPEIAELSLYELLEKQRYWHSEWYHSYNAWRVKQTPPLELMPARELLWPVA